MFHNELCVANDAIQSHRIASLLSQNHHHIINDVWLFPMSRIVVYRRAYHCTPTGVLRGWCRWWWIRSSSRCQRRHVTCLQVCKTSSSVTMSMDGLMWWWRSKRSLDVDSCGSPCLYSCSVLSSSRSWPPAWSCNTSGSPTATRPVFWSVSGHLVTRSVNQSRNQHKHVCLCVSHARSFVDRIHQSLRWNQQQTKLESAHTAA